MFKKFIWLTVIFIAGVLLAPKSGKETRRQLVKKFNGIKTDIREVK